MHYLGRRRRWRRRRWRRRSKQQSLHGTLWQRLRIDQRNEDEQNQNRAIDDAGKHHPTTALGLDLASGFKRGIFKHGQPRIECWLLLLRHRENRKCSRALKPPYRSVFTLSELRLTCKTCCKTGAISDPLRFFLPCIQRLESHRESRETFSPEQPRTTQNNRRSPETPVFQPFARFAAGNTTVLPCLPRHSCQATNIGAATAIDE